MPALWRNVRGWFRENWPYLAFALAMAPFVVVNGLFDQWFGPWWPLALYGLCLIWALRWLSAALLRRRNEHVQIWLISIIGGGLAAIILPWVHRFFAGSFLWQMVTTFALAIGFTLIWLAAALLRRRRRIN